MNSSTYYKQDTDLRFTMLTPEQETDLFVKTRAGDTEAREFLIKNHLLFAAMHARKLAKGQLPETEVVSAANLALMTAFEKFDHTHGSRFTSYLRPFIQGEVSKLWKDHFNSDIPVETLDKVGTEDPHEARNDEEHQGWLNEVLNDTVNETLNAHELEILRLIYREGRSCAEIARTRTPKVSRAAIQATHSRALAKLRAAFLRQGICPTK